MSAQTIEERLTAVETKLQEMKREREQKKEQDSKAGKPRGWKSIVGVFANDPEFEEAMRIGREYRESLRPKNDEEV